MRVGAELGRDAPCCPRRRHGELGCRAACCVLGCWGAACRAGPLPRCRRLRRRALHAPAALTLAGVRAGGAWVCGDAAVVPPLGVAAPPGDNDAWCMRVRAWSRLDLREPHLLAAPDVRALHVSGPTVRRASALRCVFTSCMGMML